jgi:pSer/pThr/pTyr-binding forkhead associated (FHA) protein
MPKFIIKTGKHQGKILKLPERTTTIGRELECDIRITDSDVSRIHCELVPRDGELYVIDLKSRNGTCINDIAIQEETQLHAGDQLRVGPMVFELAGTKKITKKIGKKNSNHTSDDLSDDAISSWLTEELNESDPSPGDTTIISASQSQAANPPSKPKSPTPKLKDKKEYHSIAEEAADIIKKHWERIAEEKSDNE